MAKSEVPPRNQLLIFLNVQGEGIPIAITPMLRSLYSDIAEDTTQQTLDKVILINSDLNVLIERRLVSGINRLNPGSDGTNTFIRWEPMTGFITNRGVQYLERQFQRDRDKLTQRVAEATIAANQATIDSFEETKKSNIFQRRTQKWSIALASLSTLFIVVTIWQSHASKTDSKIESITTQMKEDKKAFDSINSNLKKLYKIVQATKSDTLAK